ncbi:LytTR family DNA-binding domain-containing protein [Robertkochia flava]|uniref:LytTR family DNA-binding domain-containing protein n=1 Tax=Robertkochia flava TaxID=3447986 RepID=UPI001CD010FC|nr:LytTR family DNA-binding domain-containing protein [Robertkochia marina]
MKSACSLNLKSTYWNCYSPDIKLFLILIPLIAGFNYYLTYSNIRLNGFLLLTFTLDTLQGYMAWLSVRHLIILLDEKLPFHFQPSKRILVQVFFTTLVGLLVISLTTEMLSLIFKGEFASVDFYTFDLFIISIWFLVINGIYLTLYFHNRSIIPTEHEGMAVRKPEGLTVRAGNKEVLVPFGEIFHICRDGDYTLIETFEAEQYFLHISLKELENSLPTFDFFRLNRGVIMNRKSIKGFHVMETRKLEIIFFETKKVVNTQAFVSRTRAPEFKKWFAINQVA